MDIKGYIHIYTKFTPYTYSTHIIYIYRIHIPHRSIQILSDVLGIFLFNPEGRSVGEKKTLGSSRNHQKNAKKT